MSRKLLFCFRCACCLLFWGGPHLMAQPTVTRSLMALPGQVSVEAQPALSTRSDDLVLYAHALHLYLATNGHRRRNGTLVEGSAGRAYELTRLRNPLLLRQHPEKLSLQQVRTSFGTRITDIGCAFGAAPKMQYVVGMSAGGQRDAPRWVPHLFPSRNSKFPEQTVVYHLVNDCALECSNFHPTMDPKERMLVFASHRQPSEGGDMVSNQGAELYFLYRHRETWKGPFLLPKAINTQANEVSPYFGPNGMLFFASDRAGGQGGYDLYSTHVSFDSVELGMPPHFGPVLSFPAPVNSSADELEMAWLLGADDTTRVAYIASRRNGSDLDIYRMKVEFPTIQGRLLDAATGEPLANVPATIMRAGGGNPITLSTDQAGRFALRARGLFMTNLELQSDMFEEVRIEVGKMVHRAQALGTDLGDIRVRLHRTMRQVVVQGIVLDEHGAPFSHEFSIRYFHRDSLQMGQGSIRVDGAEFIGSTTTHSDFYLDVAAPGYATWTQHFYAQDLRSTDTLRETIQLARGGATIFNVLAIDSAAQEPVSYPVVKLLRFDRDAPVSEIIGLDVGDSLGLFRICIPDSHALCSLIVAPEGYLPVVLDLRRDRIPSRIAFISIDRYFTESIKIYHPYAQPSPEILSRRELEQISQFLLDSPNARIRVASHTDCRGSADFNLKLSRQRASAIADYIVRRTGIAHDRMTEQGYGETQLADGSCDCNPDDCSIEDHGRNRRTEITLTSK